MKLASIESIVDTTARRIDAFSSNYGSTLTSVPSSVRGKNQLHQLRSGQIPEACWDVLVKCIGIEGLIRWSEVSVTV